MNNYSLNILFAASSTVEAEFITISGQANNMKEFIYNNDALLAADNVVQFHVSIAYPEDEVSDDDDDDHILVA